MSIRQMETDAIGVMNSAISYEYDSVGNLTRTVDPRGNDELWVYNELDQIVRHLSPPLGTGMGTRVSNELWYDGNDNLVLSRTENRDETGALGSPPFFDTQFIYDGLDGLTQLVDVVDGGLSITNEYEYDGNRNRVLVRSPEAVEGTDPTNVVVLVYDERDLLFQRSRAPGSALQTTDLFDYDPNGNPVARVEDLERPDGATETQFEYDGYDRLVGRVDAMGNRETRMYDANGNILVLEEFGELNDVSPGSASNVLFTQTHYAYDSLDRQVRQVDSFFDIETGVPIGDGEVETRRVFAPNSTLISQISLVRMCHPRAVLMRSISRVFGTTIWIAPLAMRYGHLIAREHVSARPTVSTMTAATTWYVKLIRAGIQHFMTMMD